METENLSSEEYKDNNIEDLKGYFDTAIVVLQGGIRDDGNLPVIAKMRMFAGIIEYHKALERGLSPVLILSGGATAYPNNEPIQETAVMKELMLKYDVDSLRVIEETDSIDTISNAKYSSEILEKLGFLENGITLLITNEFHLQRSKNAFKRYYKGPLFPVSAEEILKSLGDRYRLPNDVLEKPYGKYAMKFIESIDNTRLGKKDNFIELFSFLPGGRDLLLLIANLTRK
ncbi:YdcF family protein [Candidatus Dojkabacteria bacterium]|nr:YdcF family protein [Candidatus Dojkabacteria bacterium]